MYRSVLQKSFRLFFESPAASVSSRFLGMLAQKQLPAPFLRGVIKLYSLGFGVNTNEVAAPEGGYSSFSQFFGRHLRPGCRPIDDDAATVVSPCDGAITAFGAIGDTNSAVLNIKGQRYSLSRILGDHDEAQAFFGGRYLTIYLAPGDYHRVHVPTAVSLSSIRHIPGSRYSVADWSEKVVDLIHEKNERIVFNGKLPGGGLFSLIMVAAFGVGNIQTEHCSIHGKCGYRARTIDIAKSTTLDKGEEIGAFLLGSTVLMVWSKGLVTLDTELELGRVLMGQRIGSLDQ